MLDKANQKSIQDWLREDHRRNEMKRDIEGLKQDLVKVIEFLLLIMLAIVLIFALLLILLWTI